MTALLGSVVAVTALLELFRVCHRVSRSFAVIHFQSQYPFY